MGEVSTENFYWSSRMIAAMADASYIHGGGRIGVVIAADGASDDANHIVRQEFFCHLIQSK